MPSVGVDLAMENSLELKCSLDGEGKFIPGPLFCSLFPPEFLPLFNLTAVAFFSDLVVGQIASTVKVHKEGKTSFKIGAGKREGETFRIKRIPRGGPFTASERGAVHERTPNVISAVVDPFRRRLPPGSKPSFSKVIEADQFGINLQGPGYPKTQYTFVRGHIRGNKEMAPEYSYSLGYRAVKTLESIMNLLGLL